MGSFQSDRCYLDDDLYQDIHLDTGTPIRIAEDALPSSRSQHNKPNQTPNNTGRSNGNINHKTHNDTNKDIHSNLVDKSGSDIDHTTTYSSHISPKHKVLFFHLLSYTIF